MTPKEFKALRKHLARKQRPPKPQPPTAVQAQYVLFLRKNYLRFFKKTFLEEAKKEGLNIRLDSAQTLTSRVMAVLTKKIASAAFMRGLRGIAQAAAMHSKLQLTRQLFSGLPLSAVKKLTVNVFENEKWLGPEIEAFAQSNVELIQDASLVAMDKLAPVVFTQVSVGARSSGLEAFVKERFDVADAHARLIARDQVSKLTGAISMTRQEKLGVTHFVWRTVGDGRVRTAHEALNGKTFAWASPPPEGVPGEPIQCRCYAEPVLPEFE